jgi:hypothetical protein
VSLCRFLVVFQIRYTLVVYDLRSSKHGRTSVHRCSALDHFGDFQNDVGYLPGRCACSSAPHPRSRDLHGLSPTPASNVHVFSNLPRKNSRDSVPVIRRRNVYGINVLQIENLTKILVDRRRSPPHSRALSSFALYASDTADRHRMYTDPSEAIHYTKGDKSG